MNAQSQKRDYAHIVWVGGIFPEQLQATCNTISDKNLTHTLLDFQLFKVKHLF